MNEKKVYTALLADMVKGKLLQGFYFDERFGVINNKTLWLFEFDKFLLNKDKLIINEMCYDLSNVNYISAHKTDVLRDLDSGVCVYIESDDNVAKILIDKKMLETFDKDCNLKIKGKNDPVLVFEEGLLVGAIAPVSDSIQEEEEDNQTMFITNSDIAIKEEENV